MLWLPAQWGQVFTERRSSEPVLRDGEPPDVMDGFTGIPQNRIFGERRRLSALRLGRMIPSRSANSSSAWLPITNPSTSTIDHRYTHDQQTGVVYSPIGGYLGGGR